MVNYGESSTWILILFVPQPLKEMGHPTLMLWNFRWRDRAKGVNWDWPHVRLCLQASVMNL